MSIKTLGKGTQHTEVYYHRASDKTTGNRTTQNHTGKHRLQEESERVKHTHVHKERYLTHHHRIGAQDVATDTIQTIHPKNARQQHQHASSVTKEATMRGAAQKKRA